MHRQFLISPHKIKDGSVLALLSFSSIFSHHNSTVGEFWCTIAIMQQTKKQQNFLGEIECLIFHLFLSRRLPLIEWKSERDLVGMELTGLLRGSDSNISNIRWP